MGKLSGKSVIVIGAGITGVSIAEFLRRDGWSVTLVDRVEPGDASQASYGNGGILARCAVVPVSVPGLLAKVPRMLVDPSSPLFLRWSYLPRLLPWLLPFLQNGRLDRLKKIVGALGALTFDAVDQHLALAKGTGAERFIKTGDYAYLYKTRKSFESDALGFAFRREQGLTFEMYGREKVAALDPHISEEYQFAAVFPDHGWITSPGEYVTALAKHFCASGGAFKRGEVKEVVPGNPASVILDGGERLDADKVVLAAGVWSHTLARMLGQSVNMESERGYHLVLKSPSFKPSIPFMVADAKFVVTPMETGIRLAGIIELGGLKAEASQAPINLLRRQIRSVYPTLTWDGEETWMGHRPSTPDSLPVLGNAPGAEGVVYAFGSQHIGLTIGPRLGRIIADILAGRRSNVDLTPYGAERFGKQKT